LNVDHGQIRVKLRELGAVCEIPMRLMRRNNFDYPDDRLDKVNGWIRIRDEGNKVTLGYKQLDHRGLHGTKEVSVAVGDFDKAQKLLLAIGLKQKSYQETKRESWRLGNVEIELDEWPWIMPFVELESQNEEELKDIAQKLGLDWLKVVHGSVEIVYQTEYDVTEAEVDGWPEIKFGSVPSWLEKLRK